MGKEDLYIKLYQLTLQFTRALQPRYYYQYRGAIEDLASEIYLQFITPKGRGDSKKENLLEKYNPEVTSLAYLTKVCVARKLIDFSRQNPEVYSSLDALIELGGDTIFKTFDLVSNQFAEDESLLTNKSFLRKVEEAYDKLSETQRNKLFVDLFDSDSPLTKVLKPAIHTIHNCPVQQITEKTVVLFVPECKILIKFATDDGHPRGLIKPFSLEPQEVKTLRPYHSNFHPDLFLEFCMKAYV